jgi:hypothetical protein
VDGENGIKTEERSNGATERRSPDEDGCEEMSGFHH